jgi:signal transduction histidine kinase
MRGTRPPEPTVRAGLPARAAAGTIWRRWGQPLRPEAEEVRWGDGRDAGRAGSGSAAAAARAYQEVLADRDRMARELHDRVIGRIFAAGMSLQGIAAVVGRAELSARVEGVIAELDRSIDEIREAIFRDHRGHAEPVSLRSEVLGLASETLRRWASPRRSALSATSRASRRTFALSCSR